MGESTKKHYPQAYDYIYGLIEDGDIKVSAYDCVDLGNLKGSHKLSIVSCLLEDTDDWHANDLFSMGKRDALEFSRFLLAGDKMESTLGFMDWLREKIFKESNYLIEQLSLEAYTSYREHAPDKTTSDEDDWRSLDNSARADCFKTHFYR